MKKRKSTVFHQASVCTIWEKEGLLDFDELFLSWCGERKHQGMYFFYVSVKVDDWSKPLLYASWGKEGQSTYSKKSVEDSFQIYQDAAQVLDGKKATGFRILIETEGGASIESLYSLHVFINCPGPFYEPMCYQTIDLPVTGLSQMMQSHERADSLCSPVSITAVLKYLLNKQNIDPLAITKGSWDQGFQIFGNWVLNTAEASTWLGENRACWVQRCTGFDEIYRSLSQSIPVIVSVRGPLIGSAREYAKGHLLVVKGFDKERNEVLCMDPAFSSHEKTLISYPYDAFVKAWERRGKIAYMFQNLS